MVEGCQQIVMVLHVEWPEPRKMEQKAWKMQDQ